MWEVEMAKEAWRIVNGDEKSKTLVKAVDEVKRKDNSNEIVSYRCKGVVKGDGCTAIMMIYGRDSDSVRPYFHEFGKFGKHIKDCPEYVKGGSNRLLGDLSRNPKKINLGKFLARLTRKESLEKSQTNRDVEQLAGKEKKQKQSGLYNSNEPKVVMKSVKNLNDLYIVLSAAAPNEIMGDGRACGEGIINKRTIGSYKGYKGKGCREIKGAVLVIARKVPHTELGNIGLNDIEKYQWVLKDPYRVMNQENISDKYINRIYYVLVFKDKKLFFETRTRLLKILSNRLCLVFCDWKFSKYNSDHTAIYVGEIESSSQLAFLDTENQSQEVSRITISNGASQNRNIIEENTVRGNLLRRRFKKRRNTYYGKSELNKLVLDKFPLLYAKNKR